MHVADNANGNQNSYLRCGAAYQALNGHTGSNCGHYAGISHTSGNFQASEVEVFYFADFDSSIIPPQEQREFLIALGFEQDAFTNIYRASADGYGARDFHKRVNGYTKTLTIIQTTTGYVFGVYTNAMHSDVTGFVADSGAFLFSYINPNGQIMRLPITKSNLALYNDRTLGPSFGNDIVIPDKSDSNPGQLTFDAFTPPQGYSAGDDGAYFLINDVSFTVAEIETFMLAYIPETQFIDSLLQPDFMRLIQLQNKRMEKIFTASTYGFQGSVFHKHVIILLLCKNSYSQCKDIPNMDILQRVIPPSYIDKMKKKRNA